MEIYKINHVDFQYDETEREEFLKHIASIHSLSELELITEDVNDIAHRLFKEPKMDKGVSRHTYVHRVYVTLDSTTNFEFNQYPKFVKNKEGKTGLLIGHYDIGWTLLFPSDSTKSKILVNTVKSTYSRNTKRYTNYTTSVTRDFDELDKPKLSLRERFIQSLK